MEMLNEIRNGFNLIKLIKTFFDNKDFDKDFLNDLDDIFKKYEKEFENIIVEILDKMKEILLEKKEKNKNIGKELKFIENLKDNSLEKIDNLLDNILLKSIFKIFFYNGILKEETEKLNLKIKNFRKLLKREVRNYYNGEKTNIKLLIKEKNKNLRLLENYFIVIEKDIVEKLYSMLPKLLLDNVKNGNGERNEELINNFKVLINDVKKGTMHYYYKKVIFIFDNMFNEIIDLINKE